MMRFIKSRPWTSLSIIVMAILVGVNAFYVFKDNSKVARSYFVDEFQRATVGDRVETVKKMPLLHQPKRIQFLRMQKVYQQ